jgi:polyferredoxin
MGRPRLLEATHAHRYQRRRLMTVSLSLALLFAVPAAHLARFDAWGGEHWALGRRVDGVYGLGALLMAIGGFYLITFLLNAGFGRIFCGWGCPIAQVSRLGDAGRLFAAIGFDALLAAALLSWWVGPRALADGGVILCAIWAALTAAFVVFGFTWRWDFCRRACPIGLYYSIVQTSHRFGIHFDAARCIDCGKCAAICPVALEPRDLARPVENLGGLAVDGMPARHHCLTCGDCVRACELVLKQRPREEIPLKLGLRR